MKFDKIYGYVRIIETIKFKKDCIILGGILIHYDRNGKVSEVSEETENIIIRCAA